MRKKHIIIVLIVITLLVVVTCNLIPNIERYDTYTYTDSQMIGYELTSQGIGMQYPWSGTVPQGGQITVTADGNDNKVTITNLCNALPSYTPNMSGCTTTWIVPKLIVNSIGTGYTYSARMVPSNPGFSYTIDLYYDSSPNNSSQLQLTLNLMNADGTVAVSEEMLLTQTI